MNVILLSGGSGKRLWPLSNEIRSKQFIKLFKHGDSKESMLERVYRQIKTVDSDAEITIATSKTQVSAIHNQIGENVSVCVEPMRRDTFPAIALACAFLRDVKNVDLDESIVVCPVDPYVEDTYYEAVKKLGDLAGKRNLTLMGIQPSYPSEKYGYIIPKTQDDISEVKEFKEKPDAKTAQRYLKQGAVWNAGVFAFKLSYLLNKAHEILDFKNYYDLFDHYESCPKISFDYAVVEKEPSVSVLRYTGTWRDVGTWNMMAEVMADPVIGNAILDGTTTNTNVVNELDIPILIIGAHDMIVAASSDGILVSDKEQSGHMKPYVDRISTDVHYADKSWGTYRLIDSDANSRIIKVTLKAGHRMSYHSHQHRNEVWTVISGTGRTIIDGMEQRVKSGDVITMQAGCRHTVIADSELHLIEVQLGKDISVTDKKKYNLNEE